MQKNLTVAAIVVGVLLCVLIAVLVRGPRGEEAAAPKDDASRQIAADLEAQVQAVTSERDSLQEELAALQQQSMPMPKATVATMVSTFSATKSS